MYRIGKVLIPSSFYNQYTNEIAKNIEGFHVINSSKPSKDLLGFYNKDLPSMFFSDDVYDEDGLKLHDFLEIKKGIKLTKGVIETRRNVVKVPYVFFLTKKLISSLNLVNNLYYDIEYYVFYDKVYAVLDNVEVRIIPENIRLLDLFRRIQINRDDIVVTINDVEKFNINKLLKRLEKLEEEEFNQIKILKHVIVNKGEIKIKYKWKVNDNLILLLLPFLVFPNLHL